MKINDKRGMNIDLHKHFLDIHIKVRLMSTTYFTFKIKDDLNYSINKSNVFPSSKCQLINVGVTNEAKLKWRLGNLLLKSTCPVGQYGSLWENRPFSYVSVVNHMYLRSQVRIVFLSYTVNAICKMTTMNIEYPHTRLFECAIWPESSSNS